MLEESLKSQEKQPTDSPSHTPDISDPVRASVDTGVIPPPEVSTPDPTEKQPLLQFPKERLYDQPASQRERLRSIKEAIDLLPPPDENPLDETPKVIFATGGISNGNQALEVLNAGASVAMVYTALVYGGAGTISRIKDEMREEMKATKKKKRKGKRSSS